VHFQTDDDGVRFAHGIIGLNLVESSGISAGLPGIRFLMTMYEHFIGAV